MTTMRLGGIAALVAAFGLGACSHTTVENPSPATGATVTTTTTANADTTMRRDTVGYAASGTTTTSTTIMTPGTTSTDSAVGMSNGAHVLTLQPVNNSGFGGNVTLTDLGGKTRVALTLNSPANTDADADHNAMIHTGTCEAPGAVDVGLHDVEGNGKASNTEVDRTMGQLMDGNHIIVAHENPGSRPIVCVAIPAM